MSKVKFIELPQPDMGGKCWLLEEKGIFCLERGPGSLITMALTHAGSGSLAVFDGVPDENGFFPDEEMQQPVFTPPLDIPKEERDELFEAHLKKVKTYYHRHGRPFVRQTPVVMGSWMLNAGFYNGLTIKAEGGTPSASVIASIVWMPFGKKPDEKAS